MSSLGVYQNLECIENFTEVARDRGYVLVPDDWNIIISDIRSSTRAINNGRYKEVNLLGAAAIAAVKNILATQDFPFVFGGDGATMALPSNETNRIRLPLQQLQLLARDNFDLELRVGIVPVREILAKGSRVLMGKLRVGKAGAIAVFRGGGLQLAEALIKTDKTMAYLLPLTDSNLRPTLNELSCRWNPIENRNGLIVTLMIQPRELATATLVIERIINDIHPFFEIEKYRPFHVKGLIPELLLKNLWREFKLRNDLSLLEKWRQIILPALIMRFMIYLPFGTAHQKMEAYKRDSMDNSDYKKLDDTLRMVLDCSEEQALQLEQLLEKYRNRNEIYFGLVRSSSALMTCIVQGMSESEHIHFIDGSSGGYAKAAEQLKAQRK